MVHRIRLRKPWTRHDLFDSPLVPAVGTDESHPAQRTGIESISVYQVDVPDVVSLGDNGTQMPAGHQESSSAHQATYCRRFNRPSGIAAGDRVQLEVGQVAGRLVDIRINSKTIANFADNELDASKRYDVTNELADHNELEIEIQTTGEKPRLQGAVNLWIVSQE